MSKVESRKSKVKSFKFLVLSSKFSVLLLSFLFCQNIQAQSPVPVPAPVPDTLSSLIRPSVGVVLSGGGAKGFAHIGVLKVIEEAGLPVDYIGGTSMGSIIGALYAMGYDLETMIQLTKEQNWDAVMSDAIPQKFISVDEKRMDRHYLATFPFRNNKIQMKSAIHEGEMINLLLARLMSPAYKIEDYNELKIPFLCVATDIENATAYEMTKGNLQRSVRASMSIPFYFAPIELDGHLLVDGGLRNNFPVSNVRDKSVDIIIGVDVQRGFHTKDELNSMATILDQMIAMTDIDANIKAKENVDIYIKPELSDFSMMDFNSFDTIINIGEAAAREFLPQLKHLADSIKSIQNYQIQHHNTKPIDSIYIVSLKIDGVREENATFIRKSFSKKYPTMTALSDIENTLMSIYATGYFKDIWYELIPAAKGATLRLHCQEKEEETVSVAAHYDTDYGIGILANITLKNVLGFPRRSTIAADVNIAEDPYFKLRFHSNVSQRFKYGADVSMISLAMNQYDDNTINNSYRVQDNRLDLFLEVMPTLEQQLRLGVVANYVHLRDKLVHVVSSDKYDFISHAYFNYHLNNENSPTFASRGWKLNLNAKYIVPVVKLDDGSRMGNSIVVRADLDGAVAIGRHNSLKFGFTAGSSVGGNELPLSYQFFVGGQSHMNYFDNIISFEGLRFTQLYGDHIAFAKISWQYNFYKNLYAIANCNAGYMSSENDNWFTDDNFIIGCGLTLGMKTMAGPIEVSLMGSNRCSNLIGFFNIGYWF